MNLQSYLSICISCKVLVKTNIMLHALCFTLAEWLSETWPTFIIRWLGEKLYFVGSTTTTVISIPHERQKLLEKEETITNKFNRGDQLEEEKLKQHSPHIQKLSYHFLISPIICLVLFCLVFHFFLHKGVQEFTPVKNSVDKKITRQTFDFPQQH